MTGIESLDQLQRDLDNRDRDRAVLARIGGGAYRSIFTMPHSLAWADDTIDLSAQVLVELVQRNRKASRRAYLPEAAFDWPIYRIARQPFGDGDTEVPTGFPSCGSCTALLSRTMLPGLCHACGTPLDEEGATFANDPNRCAVPGCDGLLATDRLCDGHADV